MKKTISKISRFVAKVIKFAIKLAIWCLAIAAVLVLLGTIFPQILELGTGYQLFWSKLVEAGNRFLADVASHM